MCSIDQDGEGNGGGLVRKGGCRRRVETRDVRGGRERCKRRRRAGVTEISILVRFEASNEDYAIDEVEM